MSKKIVQMSKIIQNEVTNSSKDQKKYLFCIILE